MKRTLFLAALALAASIIVCTFCAVSCIETGESQASPENKTVNVIFMLDKKVVYSTTIPKGGKVEKPLLSDLDEAPFIVWTHNGGTFNFKKSLKYDTVLTASLAIKFTVSFKADGKTVKTCDYSYYDRDIAEPKVPDKKGYTGEWESYETTGGDVTVNAAYTPIVYHVDYYMDSTVASTVTCTIEDYESLIPEVPNRYGYIGKWVYEEVGENKYTATAEYEPKLFTAEFYADGKLVKSVKVYGDEEVVAPAVPEKKYYDGVWSVGREDGQTFT